MAGRKDISKDAVPFKKGKDERRNLNGRPRKLISEILKEFAEQGIKPVTSEQIRAMYESLLIMNETELKEVAMNIERPMLMRIVSKAILGNKGFEIIERMIDRAHGKSKQQTELTGKDGKDLLPQLIINTDIQKSIDNL